MTSVTRMTSTSTDIRALVRRQLLWYLENDLKGGEELMKEVWEQCETDDHVVAAKHELEEIIDFLRDRDRDPRLKRGAEEVPLDAASLRDAFRFSNEDASRRALWCSGFPGAEPNTCRYCGKHWRQWFGSKLDGHSACIVTDDFKRRVANLLRASPTVTYGAIAEVIGVTSSVVRSWMR